MKFLYFAILGCSLLSINFVFADDVRSLERMDVFDLQGYQTRTFRLMESVLCIAVMAWTL